MVKSIQEAAALVVFLHDETCASEWCQYEWQLAKQFKLPVLCVADMHNCHKRKILDQLHATPHGDYLLSFQMVEYTLKHRRDAIKEIAQWLNTHVKAQPNLQKQGTKSFMPPPAKGAGGFAAMEAQLSRQPSKNFHSKPSCMGDPLAKKNSELAGPTGTMPPGKDKSMIMGDMKSMVPC